jgi:hypothetical protein
METILIMICFAFVGEPNECGIASLEPTAFNERTVADNVNVFCTAARRALAAEYPGATVTKCELWQGEPLGSDKT